MANNNNMIRMSGMNSGLDTEAIINALTANSKLKITKQNRQLLKYQATQEAYREVIDKMQALKSKYFDILNNSTNLKGTSMWSKYASTTTVGGEEKKVAGFSVSTSIDSTPGTYKIKVNRTATQSTRTGSSLSSAATVNVSSFEENKSYGISVTVGNETKNIVFDGGADALDNLNNALTKAFGESNESMADEIVGGGTGSGAQGLVYVDSNGNFISRERKGLTISGVGEMKPSTTLDLSALESGNNAVAIQVGDKVINVSFQTLKDGYFDVEQKKDENGELVFEKNEDGTDKLDGSGNKIPVYEVLSKDKEKLLEQVKEDYIESKKYADYEKWRDDYDNWKNGIDPSDPLYDKTAAKVEDLAFDKAQYENRMKYLDNKSALNSFLKDYYAMYKNGVESGGGTAKSFDDWKTESFHNYKEDYDNYVKQTEEAGGTADDYDTWKAGHGGGSVYDAFEAAYWDTQEGQDITSRPIGNFRLNEYYDKEYNKYVNKLSDPSTALSRADWTNAVTTEGNELYSESVKKGADRIISKYTTGYELDREMWETVKYNEYEAFKEFVIDADTSAFENRAGIDLENIPNQTIIDHFNTSSVNNSIGAAQIKADDGVVNIKVDYDNAGNAVITANKSLYELEYEDEAKTIPKLDKDGNQVYAKDEKGNFIFQKDGNGDVVTAPVDFTITSAKGSVSDLNIPKATTSVSQISNTTVISDLGVQPDSETGKYEFSINGVKFSFDGDMTVKDMMARVNASKAGVKMTYSSLDNAFTIAANEYGVNSSVVIDSDGGLLEAIGLGSTAEYKQGVNLEVEINDKPIQSNGNSVTIDGNTFSFAGGKVYPEEFEVTIEKDYTAIKDTIKSFIEDYNKLIEDVYKMLDEKPDKDYYFLADADKEDMDLSEKQEEKWEAKAKLGLLYHDSTISTAMTRLRTSLMGFIVGADGNDVSLASIGIKTASDYKEHGKLTLDEDKLTQAIMERGDDIAKLFSDKENGIMTKFADALEGAVGTTGDKGTLINRAGMATGSSATNNFIYNQMKRITQNISSLERRYEKEQDRLWKKYSAMESMMGTLNSQSASMMSYFGGGGM